MNIFIYEFEFLRVRVWVFVFLFYLVVILIIKFLNIDLVCSMYLRFWSLEYFINISVLI